MPVLNEEQHKGEFIVTEANGTLSRDNIVVVSGQNLKAGHVIGKINVGSATGAAASGNVGNGTITGVSAGASAKAGVYVIMCIEPATNAGMFSIEDPDGVTIGRVNVAVAFTGAINFTLNDGATDFAAGDRFTVTVTAGSGKYKEWNPANSDGSQVAFALLLDNIDATAGDKEAVAIVRSAEFNENELIWFSGATTNDKAAAVAQLAIQGLISRK
jgi:hypothetical protein